MSVKWAEIKTCELKDRVRTLDVKAGELIQAAANTEEFVTSYYPEGKDVRVIYDTRELIKPLGQFGQRLQDEKAYGDIRTALAKYWSYTKEPIVSFDVIRLPVKDEPTKEDWMTLRRRIEVKKPLEFKLNDIVSQMPLDRLSSNYNRCIVGGERNHIELQLLSEARRRTNKAGEFFDPGIFVMVNGKVQIATGVHWLACTNGLTNTRNFWTGEGFDFLESPSLLNESIELMNFLLASQDRKVHNIRELSMTLSAHYSKPYLNRFWKEWADRISLDQLTWYDVMDDLTRSVRNSLAGFRYKVLEVKELVSKHYDDRHCPTCSSLVEETVGA